MAVAEREDIDATLALLQRAVATPSVTGDEGAFARLVADQLEATGADVVRIEEPAPGRPAVWRHRHGVGRGRGERRARDGPQPRDEGDRRAGRAREASAHELRRLRRA